ncbi:MAG TPA: hypothetical protein VKX33_04650 [Cyclobacteriaceae bacterium]|nr:hypothetical protein [Cyclobacteriaceae bacterium]
MEKNNIAETLKEAISYLKDNKVSYEDEQGNVYTLEQAKREKIFVRLIDGKSKGEEILSDLGLDITQSSVRNLLSELASLVGGKGSSAPSSRTSKRLSEDEKRSLVNEFNESGSKNKREFTNNKGVGYQSFLKWEKEFSQSK